MDRTWNKCGLPDSHDRAQRLYHALCHHPIDLGNTRLRAQEALRETAKAGQIRWLTDALIYGFRADRGLSGSKPVLALLLS